MAEEIIKVKIDLDVDIFSKNAKAMSDALSKVLGKEVEIFNGKIARTAKLVSDTEKALGGAANTAGRAANSVKQSNQQWTNFALVIQDLPYGFRGIQNNLPALASSIAGFAGPAYLAFSALVAIITAYDMGLFGAKKTTDEFAKSLADVNKNIKSSVNYSTDNIAALQSLIRIGTDLNNSEGIRKKALTEIKDILGQVNKEEADRITNMGQAVLAVNLYTEALRAQQLQEVSGKKIAELQMGLIEKRDLLDKKRRANEREINPLKPFFGDKEVQNLQAEILNTEALIRKLEDLNQSAIKANLSNPYSNFNKPKKGGQEEKLEDNSIALLRSQQQYYKDNILMFAAFEQEIIKRQANLDERQAKLEGKNSEFIKNIRLKRDQDIINSAKDAADKIAAIQAKLGEEEGKELKKQMDELERNRKKNYDNALQALDQFYNNQLDLAVNDRNSQIQILQSKNDDLKTGLLNGTILYEDYYKRVSDNAKKIAEIQTAIQKEAYDGLMKIGNGLMNMLGPSFDLLIEKGATLGDVLTSAFQSIIKQLAKVIALALIAVALIAIIFPGKLAAAGGAAKLFGGLVSQGMGIGGLVGSNKATAQPFANGGIISGPTYGLMGEYPGAKSNPEVVAPLDKLKDMIGGQGSGQFVLRGQDLVLALNRSEKSLTLRRG